ncbi:Rne/Rng family ribonuclease [Brevibacillus ginsengisoli]|uniref:Rne/Rng family ribonuclease n=1 Tax=Brevibacillus ginsengisoli TaxID=363854 RepID=UPI003CF6095B
MKQIVVTTEENHTRIAILEQGKLVEYHLESHSSEELIGNIYRARVENIIPNMQAAFVDIGLEKNAFLYIDDCLPADWQKERGKKEKPGIQELVRNGEELLIQVNKEAFGTKAPRVTTEISIPGRSLVYLPYGRQISISRKIKLESERKRLSQMAREWLTEAEGIIVRTSAEGMAAAQMEAELNYLRSVWKEALERSKNLKPPALLYQDSDLLIRVIRDSFTEEVQEVLVDSSQQLQRIQRMVKALYPKMENRIKAYMGKQPIFEAFGIDLEIDKLLSRHVPLANGGSIVIDRTEAMTVIDVNSGKFTGKSMQRLEETVTQTNLEATKEIARQLRLRDIGGIVVIDFIDMKASSNQERVLTSLQKELAKDHTPTHVFGMTQLGLVELTRKKIRPSVPEILTRPCPTCQERGRVLHEREVLARIRREIRAVARNSAAEAIILEVFPLFVGESDPSTEWERELGIHIYIEVNTRLPYGYYHVRFAGSDEEAKRLLTTS